MQNMLDVFTDYCKQWKLYVNIDKTKVGVFSKRRYEANHKFKVIGEEIQFSDNYCYLGVLFNYNGNITNVKKKNNSTISKNSLFRVLKNQEYQIPY